MTESPPADDVLQGFAALTAGDQSVERSDAARSGSSVEHTVELARLAASEPMMRPKRELIAPPARLAVGAQVEVTWSHDGQPTAFAGEVEVADFTGAVAQYCVRYNDGTGSHWHAAAAVREAAMATGASRITGLLEGDDVLATAEALRQLGATVRNLGDGVWEVCGCGPAGFKSPTHALDFGNSGTGARLM